MFKHTRQTFSDIVSDLKNFAFAFGVLANAFPIIYFIYAICAPAGILWVNITLLVPSVMYFVFYVIMHGRTEKGAKRVRKITRHAFTSYKLIVKLLNAITVVYSIYAATTHVTVWSIVLAAFTVVTLFFQMLLELLVIYAEIQFERISNSLSDDMRILTKPISQVKELVGKLKRDGETDENDALDNGEKKQKRFLDRFKRAEKRSTGIDISEEK